MITRVSILLFSVINLFSCAQKKSKPHVVLAPFQEGIYYVIDPNGTGVYAKPNDSLVQLPIPCGQAIHAMERLPDTVRYTLTGSYNLDKGFDIDFIHRTTHWVKVELDGREGYVPEMALSQLPFFYRQDMVLPNTGDSLLNLLNSCATSPSRMRTPHEKMGNAIERGKG